MLFVIGVRDLLSSLGVYKLPLGVYHVHKRSGAFRVTKSAKLFSPFTDLNSPLPLEFSIIMSVKCDSNFTGYIFALSELTGNQIFAIKLTQKVASMSISVEYSTDSSNQAASVDFEIPSKNSTWQQYAISVADDTLVLYYDCDKTVEKVFIRYRLSSVKGNLMMSIGPYFTQYGSQFEGAIEQLVIVKDASYSSRQCSSKTSVSNLTSFQFVIR